MRIVHVTDFYLPRLGGIETQVAGLAAHQAAAGHQVSVLTATRGPSGPVPKQDGAPIQVRRTASLTGRLEEAVTRPGGVDGVDVVHVHLGGWCPLGFRVIRARAERGLPTVVTVHSVLEGLQLLYQGLSGVLGWRRAPVVWTGVGERVAGQLRELLGEGAAVHVVPNAVETLVWAPSGVPTARRTAERPALPAADAPPRPVLLVAALRMTRRKRAEALPAILAGARDRALAQAAAAGRPAPVLRAVVAGAGPRMAAVRHGLRAHGIEDWVELPGRLGQGQLRDLYHRGDVFVAPTVLESFGLAALEARVAGLPVVARSDSGTAEVLEPGVEAVLVGNDHEMACALGDLAVDTARRERIARHNSAVPTPFDWDATLTLFGHAYATAAELTAWPVAEPLRRPRPTRQLADRRDGRR